MKNRGQRRKVGPRHAKQAPVGKLNALTGLKTDINVFANVDTNEGPTVDIERVGLPGSDGLATPAPAVKKVFIELDSKGGTPPKHALAAVEGTEGLDTLGTDGVEGNDEGRLLARSTAKAGQTVWAIKEAIAGEISPPASTACEVEGKPLSGPLGCEVEGAFATSSSPVKGGRHNRSRLPAVVRRT